MERSQEQRQRRAHWALAAGVAAAKTPQGRSELESVFTADDYAEPGYTVGEAGLICFGDWNRITRYLADTHEFETLDDAPPRVADLLEKLGVDVEWSDEWCLCAQCARAVRTKGNSYSWRSSFATVDDETLCAECIEQDPTAYLEALEGDTKRCVTFELDLDALGYRLLRDDFEHGLYGGQSADPGKIGQALRRRGVERFVFHLDAVGQFDSHFSVWVHESQFEQAKKAPLGAEETDGVDPGREMEKALRGQPSAYQVKTRMLTPEEFVSGSWLKERDQDKEAT